MVEKKYFSTKAQVKVFWQISKLLLQLISILQFTRTKKNSRIFHELFGRMRFDRLGEKLSAKNLTIDTFKISLVIFLELQNLM